LKEELKKCKSSSEEQLAVLRKQKTALERQAQSADEGIARFALLSLLCCGLI
jgi:hypothetical protein